MRLNLDLRDLTIRALHDCGESVRPSTATTDLIDHLANRSRGKRGVRGEIHIGVRKAKGRNAMLMIVDGNKRKGIGIPFIEGLAPIDHPHAKIELQIYKDEKRREAYGKVDWRLLPMEDMLQIFLDDYSKRNPRRALEMSVHVDQLNDLLAGRLLGNFLIDFGEEYAVYRMAQQIKTQAKDVAEEDKILVSFGTACAHLQTLNQALIYYCRKERIARIEFDMPKGYLEEVEYLNWDQWTRLLLAAKGLVWDPNGDGEGKPGWRKELRTDASGRTRLRFVLLPPEKRTRLKMMIRFLLIYFYTGTRYSQILKLRWNESTTEPYIDFVEKRIVRDSVQARVITNKRRETSALLTVILRQLQKWRAADAALGIDKFVIHKPGVAREYVWVDGMIKTIAQNAGLPHFTSHMSKHSGVTRLAAKGFTLSEIAALYSTTVEVLQCTYTHLDYVFQREAVAAADARGLDKMGAFAPANPAGRLRTDRAAAVPSGTAA
jgi:integrase